MLGNKFGPYLGGIHSLKRYNGGWPNKGPTKRRMESFPGPIRPGGYQHAVGGTEAGRIKGNQARRANPAKMRAVKGQE